jgi:DNA-3-methyladenine glycosylase II
MTTRQLAAARTHLMKVDPVLRRIIRRVGVYRIRYRRDKFCALVEAIINQQISVGAARATYRRVLDLYPDTLSPERLLKTSDTALRAVGLSRQKIIYLHELARQVSEGAIDLTRLGRLDDDQVMQTLTQVKGVGRWTVEMFLMFSLRRPDVLPVYDLGFRKAVQLAYGLAEPPTAAALEDLASPWRPYRSVGTHYLWASRENEAW